MTIIVDAMGGRGMPEVVVAAAAAFSLDRNFDLLVVGDETQITRALSNVAHNPERLMVRHASVEGKSPAESSIDLALKLLSRGQGSAVVTAGNAAHVLSAASSHLTLIEGVKRAALCAVYPTLRPRGRHRDPYTLILDVGASSEASAEELVGFARMGSAYAARISRNPNPRVALLVSQADDEIGPEVLREAAELLSTSGLQYVGGVGGVEIPQGGADVVVCNGFVGNVVIQLLEGIPGLVDQLVKTVEAHGLQKRIAVRVLSEDILKIADLMDWRHYGGAPLLGYDRPVIVTQSDVDAEAFKTSIKLAAKAVREDITGAITSAF